MRGYSDRNRVSRWARVGDVEQRSSTSRCRVFNDAQANGSLPVMTAQAPQSARSLWLLADIGGTHARFAYTEADPNRLQPIATYEVARFSSFDKVLAQLLTDWCEGSQADTHLTKVCMAVAANPHQHEITFTNNPWRFTQSQLAVQTGCSDIQIVNDFAAVARSLPALTAPHLEQIGDGASQLGQPMVTIGPGTGCGVATLVFDDAGNAMVLPAEGGHVDFAPTTDVEMKVLSRLKAEFGRVSIERILSGPGIMNLYRALGEIHQLPITYASPEAVGDAARAGRDRLATETMSTFCSILGSVAGDLALTIGARGGVFIAGGIAPDYLDLLHQSDFRARFLAKGRFAAFNRDIPTFIVKHPHPGLLGTALLCRA